MVCAHQVLNLGITSTSPPEVARPPDKVSSLHTLVSRSCCCLRPARSSLWESVGGKAMLAGGPLSAPSGECRKVLAPSSPTLMAFHSHLSRHRVCTRAGLTISTGGGSLETQCRRRCIRVAVRHGVLCLQRVVSSCAMLYVRRGGRVALCCVAYCVSCSPSRVVRAGPGHGYGTYVRTGIRVARGM